MRTILEEIKWLLEIHNCENVDYVSHRIVELLGQQGKEEKAQ